MNKILLPIIGVIALTMLGFAVSNIYQKWTDPKGSAVFCIEGSLTSSKIVQYSKEQKNCIPMPTIYRTSINEDKTDLRLGR